MNYSSTKSNLKKCASLAAIAVTASFAMANNTTEPGACCVPQADGGYLCYVLTESNCEHQGGYYYGNGTSCSDPFVECESAEEPGACCVPQDDGTLLCYVITSQDCQAQNGFYYGDGTSCTDPFVECDEPQSHRGACCFEDASGNLTCQMLYENECLDLMGTWYGQNVTCSDPQVNCVVVNEEGACCYEFDNIWICDVMIEEFCVDLDGFWYGPGINCSNPQVECYNEPVDECEIHEASNCAGRPRYADPEYSQVFGDGRVAVETAAPSILGGQVVTVFDLTNLNLAPNDSWFSINRYSDPDWSSQILGSIFGLAVDGDGNIFVTATKSWNNDWPGIGGWGAVYRLDHITGDVTVFATLPNTGASLGNITWDCDNNQFFVSSMEDGLVYRLDASGAILDKFDHGTPWTGSPGPAALGDRVWAVEVHGGRLYYSVWNEDRLNKSATEANQIWSVALDASGQPTGAERLEVDIPGYYKSGQTEYSSPVSDIRFTHYGSMLLAERSMNGWTNLTAHDARALEFECVDGVWITDVNRFHVGDNMAFNPGHNASGGIDAIPEQLFASGDALDLGSPDTIYGFQVLPMSGGNVTNSKIVDYQDNLTVQDKTLIGDLVVTPERETCPGDTNGDLVIDITDLLIVIGDWGPCGNPGGCPGDIDGNGVVNVIDLLAVIANWGDPC